MVKIYKSPVGELAPYYKGNLAQHLRTCPTMNEHLDKKVLIDYKSGESLSCAEVFDAVERTSWLLREKYKIRWDDVVGVFSLNSIYTPVIFHGTFSRGGIVSPANIMYNADELRHQMFTARAKILIAHDNFLDTARKAAADVPTIREVVPLSRFIAEIKAAGGREAPVYLNEEQCAAKHALYCFSSGTSGVPKGVITTHLNLIANSQQCIQSNPSLFNQERVWAAVLPMSHIYGLSKFVNIGLMTATKTIVFERFELEPFLKAVVEHKVDMAILVPPIVVLLAKHPLVDQYPIGKYIQTIFTGAAPLSGDLIEQVQRKFDLKIRQGYGLTESSPVSHMWQDSPHYDYNSIGWLVKGEEARVVKEDGTDAAVGEPGELWLRGDNIMKGYLHNPKASAETLTPDGFLRTGDVAVVDQHEQFRIVDRIKELIKSHGHQVAPAELESILLEHPNVADCAVTGYHDKELATEMPRAFVVLSNGGNPSEIKSWFDARVAKHKRLWGGIVVLDQIPKSPSGKILRRELRNRRDTTNVVGFPQVPARL